MEFKQPEGRIRDVGRIVDLFKPFGEYSIDISDNFMKNKILVFSFDQGMTISLKCSKPVAYTIMQHGTVDFVKFLTIIRYMEDNTWKIRIALKSEIIEGKEDNPDAEELKKYGITCGRVSIVR